MKNLSILFVFIVCTALHVNGQHLFTNVTLVNTHNNNMISFALPSETNVMHYRVEASNDSNDFEVIGTVASTGNSVLAKTYQFNLVGNEYRYYRIGKVGMMGSLEYSEVIINPSHKDRSMFKSTGASANQAITNN